MRSRQGLWLVSCKRNGEPLPAAPVLALLRIKAVLSPVTPVPHTALLVWRRGSEKDWSAFLKAGLVSSFISLSFAESIPLFSCFLLTLSTYFAQLC